MSPSSAFASACVFFFFSFYEASGESEILEMTFVPVKDVTIFEENFNSSGSGPHLFSGETIEGNERRLLLAFDFSALPPDAVVTQASLALVMNRTRHGEAMMSVHRLAADWGEESSNSGDRGGDGVAAAPGDATWRHRFFENLIWASEGGDFDSGASAATVVGNDGTYLWTSALLVRDVNEWLTGTRENHGWILITSGGAKRFDSREGATPMARPLLTVTFETSTPPAPTSVRLDPLSDTGANQSDRLTRDSTPTITGDSIPGATVTLFADGIEVGSGPGGPGFSITTEPLADGERIITARAVRPGGSPGQESAPLSVSIDTSPPAASIERHPETSVPASGASVAFRVVFSEAVSGLLRGDIIAGGTANPRTVRVSPDELFDGTTYRVEISGMDTEGVVTAAMGAGVVEDAAGNPNESPSGSPAALTYEQFGPSAATAAGIPFVGGTAVADAVLFPADVDFASFVLTEALEIRIATTGPIDTIGILYDARNQIRNDPRADDDRSGSGNFEITRALGPGVYFVRTSGRGNFPETSYRLSIEILRRVSFQPDLHIGERRGALKGDGIHNLTGEGQTVAISPAGGGTVTFRGRLENDGDADDAVLLKGSPSSRRMNVHFRIRDRNETAAVRRGTSQTPLRPGAGVNTETILRIGPSSGRRGEEFRLQATSLDERRKDRTKGRVEPPSSVPVPKNPQGSAGMCRPYLPPGISLCILTSPFPPKARADWNQSGFGFSRNSS